MFFFFCCSSWVVLNVPLFIIIINGAPSGRGIFILRPIISFAISWAKASPDGEGALARH